MDLLISNSLGMLLISVGSVVQSLGLSMHKEVRWRSLILCCCCSCYSCYHCSCFCDRGTAAPIECIHLIIYLIDAKVYMLFVDDLNCVCISILRLMSNLIKESSNNNQIICATHQSMFMNIDSIEKIIIVCDNAGPEVCESHLTLWQGSKQIQIRLSLKISV